MKSGNIHKGLNYMNKLLLICLIILANIQIGYSQFAIQLEKASICFKGNSYVKIKDTTFASNVKYIWQDSLDIQGWQDIANSDNDTLFLVNQIQSKKIRCKVDTNNNGDFGVCRARFPNALYLRIGRGPIPTNNDGL